MVTGIRRVFDPQHRQWAAALMVHSRNVLSHPKAEACALVAGERPCASFRGRGTASFRS
jgi:hypothetical protein